MTERTDIGKPRMDFLERFSRPDSMTKLSDSNHLEVTMSVPRMFAVFLLLISFGSTPLLAELVSGPGEGNKLDKLKVFVTDAGIGISPENQAKLFKPFYRVKDDKARHVPGTGLGLYLCLSIVKLHGGSIDVSSAPGSGSTFTITVPGIIAAPTDASSVTDAQTNGLRRAQRYRETVSAAA